MALGIRAQFHAGGRRQLLTGLQGIFEAVVEDDADIVNIIGRFFRILEAGGKIYLVSAGLLTDLVQDDVCDGMAGFIGKIQPLCGLFHLG